MALEEGDIVLCTVDRIIGTVVFVKVDRESREGSIILSEIAPGRIRNLRDYVIPKKKIVCKVLRISENRIDLSLRRVTQKETKEVMEQFRQEKSYESIFRTVLKDKAEEIFEKINKDEKIYEFVDKCKKEPKELEKLVGKKDCEKILEILNAQKIKKAILKKEIALISNSSDGITLIKEILEKIKDAEINYISAGRYLIKVESEDIKKADNKLKDLLKSIEKDAKKSDVEFSVKEK